MRCTGEASGCAVLPVEDQQVASGFGKPLDLQQAVLHGIAADAVVAFIVHVHPQGHSFCLQGQYLSGSRGEADIIGLSRKDGSFLRLAYAHGGVHTIEDVLRNCLGDSKIPGNA